VVCVIIVLSLFDGMSCGQIAFQKAGIKIDKYFASEIKKHAIKVTKHNFPETIHIGDVTKVSYKDGVLYTETGNYEVDKIDFLIGGSPCQNFSFARAFNKKIDGLEGDKSSLFYEYLRILHEIKPKYFLLENVKMKKESKEQLDKYLEVEGIYINSELVSFQKRSRYYWTNIPGVTVPEDRKINFQEYKDIDYEYCKQFKVPYTSSRIRFWNDGKNTLPSKAGCPNVTYADKIYCLTRKQDRCPNSGLIEFDGFCRFLTRRELELAQNVPVGYTDCVSYNQACDLLGEGWTVDVIAHILSFAKNN
jgi:DNA-methyltransferase (dcm)